MPQKHLVEAQLHVFNTSDALGSDPNVVDSSFFGWFLGRSWDVFWGSHGEAKSGPLFDCGLQNKTVVEISIPHVCDTLNPLPGHCSKGSDCMVTTVFFQDYPGHLLSPDLFRPQISTKFNQIIYSNNIV